MNDMSNELLDDFLIDAREHLENIEMEVIALKDNPESMDIINSLFRSFHTIKGLAGFVEQEIIQKLAHRTETLLSDSKKGKLKITPSIVEIFLKSSDYIKKICDDISLNSNDEFLATVDEHLNNIEILAAGNIDTLPPQEAPVPAVQEVHAEAIVGQPDEQPVIEEEYSSIPELNFDMGPEPAEQQQGTESTADDAADADLSAALGKEIAAEKKSSSSLYDDDSEDMDMSFLITPDMVERFIQESEELLHEIEDTLLKWINSPEDTEHVSTLLRGFHSIKGNAGILGYADLERLSHNIETILESLKSGLSIDKIKASKILLKMVDIFRETFVNISQENDGTIKHLDLHMELLNSILPKGSTYEGVKETNPRLGEILIQRGVISAQQVAQVLETQRKPFGEILVDMGLTSNEQIENALKEQEHSVDVSSLVTAADKAKITAEAAKQISLKKQNIRVDLDKLDALINLIGELVIAENMLIHNPDLDGLVLENFNKASQHMNKIIRDLQEIAMIIRMIPVSNMLRRMTRLVHDLTSKSGKKVDLKIIGEETEVDKTVIETITDPLIHIIRNALDHGLESPEERVENGKPEVGTLKITAKHEEGEVWILIEDDGRGLNKEKILSKAAGKGLIQGDGSNMSEKEVCNLIFLPGFSTADKVTDISGRGVGMDVVRQNIEKIKGKVEIKTEKGKGTTFILRIPLTLAIIDGMMVRADYAKFIIPILNIREFFRPDPKQIIISPDGQEIVRVREKFFPVLRLHNLLKNDDSKSKPLEDGILIIIESNDVTITLFVDEIVGQQQTVIKGLSDYIGNVKGVSGCTILGNGEVCLILDSTNLVEMVEKYDYQ